MAQGFAERFGCWLDGWVRWLRGVLYGMALYDGVVTFRKQRGDLEHLFVLIVFGDLVGVPIIPPYYTLRLLPYIVPAMQNWKRRMLREKDLTDLAGAG
ncbi:MAG: hypothetical protein ACE147_03505 [Candidatus Methylomirabilales bacterium]